MTMINVILIFLAYCLIGAAIRLLERIAESYILKQRQDAMMDAAYSKLVRLAGRAAADYRHMTGGGGNAM